jgi:hypothetical protein
MKLAVVSGQLAVNAGALNEVVSWQLAVKRRDARQKGA